MIRTIVFLKNHPLSKSLFIKSLVRFFYWQIAYRFLNKKEIIFNVTQKTKMFLKPGLHGASGNYYCGLLEFEDMSFCLHFLKKEDVFFDVGANVGIYSILASSHVGCKTIAFEPDKKTLENLVYNVKLNNIAENIEIVPKVVGEKKGKIKFSESKDTVNHVLNATDNITRAVEIEMTNLDEFENESPILLKIDVEGYEWDVLNGAKKIINSIGLHGIIIEINGSGNYYDRDDNLLHDFILDHGFKPYKYDPFSRKLTELNTFGNLNTIYLKNIDFVQARLSTADSFKCFNITI